MKLHEYMENCEDVVAIGSLSAYLFIGSPEEFHRDVEKLDRKNIHALEKAIALGSYRGTPEEKINRYKERLMNYTPLCEREIKEVWEADSEDRKYNILIEGEENGSYYTRHEYSGIKTPYRIIGTEKEYAALAEAIIGQALEEFTLAYRYRDRNELYRNSYESLVKWFQRENCQKLLNGDGDALRESTQRMVDAEDKRREHFGKIVEKYVPGFDHDRYRMYLRQYDESGDRLIGVKKYTKNVDLIPGFWQASVIAAMAVCEDRKAIEKALKEAESEFSGIGWKTDRRPQNGGKSNEDQGSGRPKKERRRRGLH